eukprot:gb/GECH01007408.1/.p1 GENE.gb/GECH01007408.1/~~gb/GECH01007408.1/.p1  ORF type:complete len:163 (+),score=12.41 gb/GECH01007408.1/:1-489(+)
MMVILICVCTAFCITTVWQFYGAWWEALLLSVGVIVVSSLFTIFKVRSVSFHKSMEKNYGMCPLIVSSITIWMVCIILGAGSAAFTIYVGVANNLSKDNPGKWILSNITSIILNLAQGSTVLISFALALTSLESHDLCKESSDETTKESTSVVEEEMDNISH